MDSDDINFDLLAPNPLMVVISGPSGVGKDAILDELRARKLPLHFVVTVTSRPPREGEIEGVSYFFVTRSRFEEMRARGELIENATVYSDYKGVPRSQVRQALESGKDVILRVDVQGAEQIRNLFPDAVLIFIVPHDEDEWKLRLKNRGTETDETYALRVNTAQEEMQKLEMFDYVVVNAQDRLEAAVDTITAIIEAEHHRVEPRKVIV